MGSYFLNGATIAGTLDYYRWNTIIDEERGFLYNLRWNNVYHNRSEQGQYERAPFTPLWTSSCFLDPAGGAGIAPILGQEVSSNPVTWDAWEVGETQTMRPQYIRGQTQNSGGVALGGVSLTSFVTSTNVADGSTVSDNQGNYAVPCYTPNVNHYVVAYLVGSPDVSGVSADELTPGT